MKVYLLKNIVNVGMAGEIVKVSDGYGTNYLLARKVAVLITPENEAFYAQKKREVENRKAVIAEETSMLAEKIKTLHLIIKRKMHEGQRLYGAISSGEIADLLSEQGIKVAKNQILFDKSIKEKGTYNVTVKLSSRLQPAFKLSVVAENI